jgi:hypothetical protein
MLDVAAEGSSVPSEWRPEEGEDRESVARDVIGNLRRMPTLSAPPASPNGRGPEFVGRFGHLVVNNPSKRAASSR